MSLDPLHTPRYDTKQCNYSIFVTYNDTASSSKAIFLLDICYVK